MNSKGYLHILIAIAFILYIIFEVKDFYQSKPHNYRDRKHLLTIEFPRLMGQITYELPKPDRQWQIDRQGGAVAYTYYYYNPDKDTVQKIQQNIKNNQWNLAKHDLNETLYCKEDIALVLGNGSTSESIPYISLGLSWQSRHSKCKIKG